MNELKFDFPLVIEPMGVREYVAEIVRLKKF